MQRTLMSAKPKHPRHVCTKSSLSVASVAATSVWRRKGLVKRPTSGQQQSLENSCLLERRSSVRASSIFDSLGTFRHRPLSKGQMKEYRILWRGGSSRSILLRRPRSSRTKRSDQDVRMRQRLTTLVGYRQTLVFQKWFRLLLLVLDELPDDRVCVRALSHCQRRTNTCFQPQDQQQGIEP